jgi:phenylalanyl-tRNA synthetase beta chain
VRLFEIGTVFERGPAGDLPTERRHVGIVVTGGREPAHWSASGQVADVDIWDLRSLFEAAVGLAFPSAAVQVDSDHWIAMAPDGRVVGSARRVDADAPPWAAPLFGIEVELDATERPGPTFAGLPSTPAATRDLALVLPGGLTAQSVSNAISAAAGPALERVSVLDEYRGPNQPAGSRSVAFRLVFRAPDRTLRDSEVDDAVRVTVAALENDLGVHLRAS